MQYLCIGVILLEFRRDFWHQKTRVPGLPYGVICVIICLAISVTESDRQTDGQTDRQADTQ